jgi:hypothetical protein
MRAARLPRARFPKSAVYQRLELFLIGGPDGFREARPADGNLT